ncbi:MAG: hypothetical protein JNL58_13220 [Planctomyces sp.]|nr:hypothetical protein [Planctomyces sp.]
MLSNDIGELRTRILQAVLLVFICAGCSSGEGQHSEGGTVCVILAGIHPLKDVQVSVFSDDRPEDQPIAFGISDDNGRLLLRQRESLSGFQLPEGGYRLTIESVGEFQLIWPGEFSDPLRTPLKQLWAPNGSELILDVPEPKLNL